MAKAREVGPGWRVLNGEVARDWTEVDVDVEEPERKGWIMRRQRKERKVERRCERRRNVCSKKRNETGEKEERRGEGGEERSDEQRTSLNPDIFQRVFLRCR